jgi:CBS domain-containing protein
MSPRAEWRLERLGFTAVYDYVPGKMGWLSYNLPHESEALLAGDLLHDDVPTCDVDERLGEVRARVGPHATFCVVTAEPGLVAGVLQDDALAGDAHVTAEQAMQFGVSTVRPSEDAQALVQRMQHAHVEAILVTSSDGRLLGLLLRHEAEARLAAHDREGAPG